MVQAKGRFFLGVALAAIAMAAAPAAAPAQEADRTIALAIPAQSLSGALRQLAEASGLQLVYDTRITDGKTAPAISGPMTGRTALARLLAGSGLGFQFSGDRTVIITASASAAKDGIRSIGVVNVEGVSGYTPYGSMMSPVNGINGSRDVEATEGTGSYTTGATSIVSKMPQTLRETPESVSVMTSQRIQDQDLKKIEDVLQELPGITSTPGIDGGGGDFNIYSRGFQVTQFSIDGGAPITFLASRPIIDLSEFDSVQLIRGANSLFGGYGDPGATVNLVRKKPLDHDQFTYQQQIGSYSNFHEVADLTGPLTADKHLRARVVFSQDNEKYYYKIAKGHKTSIYAIMEYDLTPKTLVSIGGDYLQQANTVNQGLPRYFDGMPIDFPTSTCLCLPYAQDKASKKEVFAIINRTITDKIAAKLNLTYNVQKLDQFFYGPSADVPEPGTGDGTGTVVLGGEDSRTPLRDFLADFTINGTFNILHRTNTFVVGGSYEYRNEDGAGSDIYYGTPLATDIFHFDPSLYPQPTPDRPNEITEIRSRTKQYTIYGNLKLELFKNLHVITGMKYSYYSLSELDRYPGYPTGFSYNTAPPLKDKNHSSPTVAVTYDFLHNFTLYGSHQIIYMPQINSRYTQSATVPPPITGSNDEIGLKWASPNKKINASVDIYKITKNNILHTDPNDQTMRIDSLDYTKSRGAEFELTGEILPRLQASISYSYNKNSTKTTYSYGPTNYGLATSFAPRSQLKAWLYYSGAPDGPIARFTGGFGVESQSSSFNTQYVCSVFLTSPYQRCPEYVQPNLTTKGYTTFSLKAGYKINSHIEVAIKANNITNVKTYASSPYEGVTAYNFYITPANFIASINAKW